MISRSSWTFCKAWNVIYNPYLNFFWIFPLELYEKVPWSWVKILTKLGQNFTKCFVSWPYVHKIITWDPSTFGRSCVKKSCRFHGYLQLSCWKFLLNHLASWLKFGSKLWKNMKFPTLRKISMFRNFDFSKWNLEFLISWWISFIFWLVLMNCDPWHLNLTKKSKFDFSVYSWLLISWLQNSYFNPMDLQCFEPCH